MAGINVIDVAGTDRPLTGIQVVDPAGTDRTITQIRVIDPAGTDRIVYDPSGASTFQVSVTPTRVTGQSSLHQITSSSTTASASGGTPPYTYSWALTSYDNVTAPEISSPNAATTSFVQTNVGYGESYIGHFTVTARDAAAGVATASVTAFWVNTSGGSGSL